MNLGYGTEFSIHAISREIESLIIIRRELRFEITLISSVKTPHPLWPGNTKRHRIVNTAGYPIIDGLRQKLGPRGESVDLKF